MALTKKELEILVLTIEQVSSHGAGSVDINALKFLFDKSDDLVVGLWDDRGNYDASTSTYPSLGGSGLGGAILKGDVWTITVAGTIGDKSLLVGDTLRALVDNPTVDADWVGGKGLQVAIYVTEQVFTPTLAQTSFTLNYPITPSSYYILTLNGLLQQEGVDYTVSGTNLTWLNADFTLSTSDTLIMRYSK